MDTIALAQVLDASKDDGGTISLERLQMRLRDLGLEEFAQAVRSLAGQVKTGKSGITENAPWV